MNNEFEAKNLAFELRRNMLDVVCTGDVKFEIGSNAAPIPPPPSGGEVIPPGPTPSNDTIIPPSGGEVIPPQNNTVEP